MIYAIKLSDRKGGSLYADLDKVPKFLRYYGSVYKTIYNRKENEEYIYASKMKMPMYNYNPDYIICPICSHEFTSEDSINTFYENKFKLGTLKHIKCPRCNIYLDVRLGVSEYLYYTECKDEDFNNADLIPDLSGRMFKRNISLSLRDIYWNEKGRPPALSVGACAGIYFKFKEVKEKCPLDISCKECWGKKYQDIEKFIKNIQKTT